MIIIIIINIKLSPRGITNEHHTCTNQSVLSRASGTNRIQCAFLSPENPDCHPGSIRHLCHGCRGEKIRYCLAGAGTLALGHNHPVVTEAIEQTLKDRLPLHTLDLTTPVKDELWRSCLTACPASSGKERKFSFAVRPVPMRWKRRSKS